MVDALRQFSRATAAWFSERFGVPTPAQVGAWQAIREGRHTLVVAPTGSGKTLSAFLWALDDLTARPRDGPACRVVYVSPLKALAVDVERNLREPLAGIQAEAGRLGTPVGGVRVGVRTGDTPAQDRRTFAKRPPDILITTPESLFLILTSAAREGLRGVETVIVDEIHAVAGTKRGAHLALSLERLDALLAKPAQRVGLSATVRPVGEVARFLAGGRDVAVVAPPTPKAWELSVVVPVPDLSDLGAEAAPGEPERATIWPHVEERVVDLIVAHNSTLVFANSRRLAERLTARVNEIWWERTGGEAPELGGGGFERRYQPNRGGPGGAPTVTGGSGGAPIVTGRSGGAAPAQVMGQAGQASGVPAMLARAHHGSVSREQRLQIEDDLKAGRLRAVVATSSLELGIDMGAIDLVIQVEAPPSVASGLQRVGRAGHQVGATSRGVMFPKYLGDLVATAVVAQRMRAGEIEALHVPANPVDVLAQQIVAMVAMDAWTVPDLLALARRAAPFVGLTPDVLEAVLDMLSGRYPSDEFAQLRPRLVWDRASGALTPRRGAQRLVVVSGGTIPDRGLFGVFVAGDGPGRRVGELDEEMVYESRVGDVFALGTSTWRIEKITHDRVLVTPAPGQVARLPFWHGEGLGRPAELGRAVGAFVREIGEAPDAAARERLAEAGLDAWAADNLLAYLRDERAAVGHLPHDRQLVVERSRDELGDWRVVVLSPYGGQVHAPWALVAAARLRERFGVDVRAMSGDDGMVFRLPDTDWGGDWEFGRPSGPGRREKWDKLASSRSDPLESGAFATLDTSMSHSVVGVGSATGHPAGFDDDALLAALFPDPEDVRDLVTAELGGSALFAARFRECAGRALLLPKRHPGQRQALWQQRLRASQLLEVASAYPSFPIVLEAVRECVNDVFDVPALTELLRAARSREVATVVVEAPRPSPFAASLLFGYVANYLYEGDAPLAERRAAALNLDATLLAQLLGTADNVTLADLLDPDELTRAETEAQRLAPARHARDPDELTDVLRELGPLTTGQLARRTTRPEAVSEWLAELAAAGRVFPLDGVTTISPATRWAAVEDAGRLRDALGVALPPGVPSPFGVPVADPIGDLLARYARAHAPFTAEEVARWCGAGVGVVRDGLRRLVAAGRLFEGSVRPPGWSPVEDPPGRRLAPMNSFEREIMHDEVAAAGLLGEPEGEEQRRRVVVQSQRESESSGVAGKVGRSWGSDGPLGSSSDPTGSSSDPPGSSSDPTGSSSGPPGSSSDPTGSSSDPTGSATQFCDPRMLALLRRRSAAALRRAVEPVTPVGYARFLPAWHEFGRRRGIDGVVRTVEQLAGVPLPASAWETLILPSRVPDYQPGMLDELIAAGEVLWQGRGPIATGDGWVSLHPADLAPLTLAPATVPPNTLPQQLLAALRTGGAQFLRSLSGVVGVGSDGVVEVGSGEVGGTPSGAAVGIGAIRLGADRVDPATGEVITESWTPTDAQLVDALWQLVWAGLVTNDTFAPIRALRLRGTTAHRARSPAAARGRYGRRLRPASSAPPRAEAAGRWSALPGADLAATPRVVLWSDLLLDRYGVVTRGSVANEELPGGFAGAYRVLAAAEDAGRVRRGYFIEGLGAAQFAEVGVVDRLRAQAGSEVGDGSRAGVRADGRPLAHAGSEVGDGSRAGVRADGRPLAHARSEVGDGSRAGVRADGRPLAHAGSEVGDGSRAGVRADGRPRAQAGPRPDTAVVLAACDPANPYGAALPWPQRPSGQAPGRKAGAVVVLVDGALALYLERGSRTLIGWTDDPGVLTAAAQALALAVHDGRLGGVNIGKVNSESVFASQHPLLPVLTEAGFRLTPSGLRLRP